jgi:hypothetical protein
LYSVGAHSVRRIALSAERIASLTSYPRVAVSPRPRVVLLCLASTPAKPAKPAFELLALHKRLDFIVTPDEQEDYVVLELKKDAVLESRADFPVVTLPVLEAEAFG